MSLASSTAPFYFGCFHLIPRKGLLLQLTPWFVSGVTCMGTRPDSSPVDFQLAIRDLSRRVDFLASRVAHLETLLEERPEVGWVVVSEECPPVESGIYGSRLCQVEDGPPPLPQRLLDFASPLIAGTGVLNRAQRAWQGGFWCGAALRTQTRFAPQPSINVPETHWVVFRAPGITRPFWVQTKEEVTHILNLPGSRSDTCRVDPIVVGFATVTELDIFCAGGYLYRPACYQWRSL